MDKRLAIAWIDLNLTVKSFLSKEKKVILSNLSGSFNFGSINALMGSSGSGKTTLLKCLNGDNKVCLSRESKIYTNSIEKSHSCFINQDVTKRLHKGLTVKQSLCYASKLKNSGQNVKVNHENNINDLMNELLISDIADNFVEKCSGGELKRLIIALELTSIIKPSILSIDEPTTGLDSNAAEVVIECLRALSRKHKMSIITSIHQPNNVLLMMFDNIYVLAKGGFCVYSGPPQDLDKHLNECEIICNEFDAPIKVLLKYAPKGIYNKHVKQLVDKTSQLKASLVNRCNTQTLLSVHAIHMNRKTFQFIDFWYLLSRILRCTYAYEWKALITQLLFYVIFCFCLTKSFNENIGKIDGCFTLNSLSNLTCIVKETQKAIIEQNLFEHYIASVSVMTVHTAITTSTFLTEFQIFSTEHRNYWYSTGSYYLAKNIAELIPTFIFSYSYSFIMYFISGQIEDGFRFYKYLFTATAGFLCTQSLGSIIGIIFHKNHRLALFVAVGVYSSISYFNNFIIPTKELFQFFQNLSDYMYPKFLYNSMLITIYGFSRCPTNSTSIVLYQFDINDDQIFWTNSKNLLYCFSIFKITEFLLLIIKANQISTRFSRIYRNLTHFKTKISKNPNDLHIERTQPEKENFCSKDIQQKELVELSDKKLMIAWIDLSFIITSKFQRKEIKILDNISGCVEIGSLNALMGPSGCGKTSLLRCLNRENTSDLSEETKIFVSSYKTIIPCFITQNHSEHLLKGLTVRQTLKYASRLKNSNEKSELSHNNMIKDLMSEFMISNIANTKVELCSGGEQKRLVIALELTSFTKPHMLCIDEPTSGLDSDAAELVVKCLKTLSKKHKMSIITSIHQPNNDIFMMYDNIYVLAKGGFCVYSGSPQDLNRHLNECDIICNESEVPIEVLIKNSFHVSDKETIKRLRVKTSQMKEPLIERCKSEAHLSSDGLQLKSKRFKAKDTWTLFLQTTTHIYTSQWKAMIMQFVIVLSIALTMSITSNPDITKPDGCLDLSSAYDQSCYDTTEKLKEESLISQNIKFNLAVLTAFSFLQIIVAPLTFISNVKLFTNEHRNCWYSIGSYFWAKSTVDIIPVIITLIPYCWIVNLDGSYHKYFGYLYFLTFSVLCAQSIGHISGIIFSENQNIANLIAFGIHLTMLILSDTFIPLKELHYALQGLSEFSYLKHTFESIMIMIYGSDRCPSGTISSVLYKLDIKDHIFWSNSLTIFLLFIAFRFISLIVLILKTNSITKIERDLNISDNESKSRLSHSIQGLTYDYNFIGHVKKIKYQINNI